MAQDTRTLLVRGSLPNGSANCCPACSPTWSVLAGDPRDVVTVPRTAVTYSLYGDSVYVVKQVAPEAPKTDDKAGAPANRNLSPIAAS